MKVITSPKQIKKIKIFEDKNLIKKTKIKDVRDEYLIVITDFADTMWSDKRGYNFLSLNPKSYTAILNPLTQRFWTRTPLDDAYRTRFIKKEGFTNESLVSNMDEDFVECNIQEHINLPIIEDCNVALKYFFKSINKTNTEELWLHGAILEKEMFHKEPILKQNSVKNPFILKDWIQCSRLISPSAQKLLIYMSVLEHHTLETLFYFCDETKGAEEGFGSDKKFVDFSRIHLYECYMGGFFKKDGDGFCFIDETMREYLFDQLYTHKANSLLCDYNESLV